jgi:hypothetical protein
MKLGKEIAVEPMRTSGLRRSERMTMRRAATEVMCGSSAVDRRPLCRDRNMGICSGI